MREDQYKIAQKALDFYMEHNRKDMTMEEMALAKRTYEELDSFIDGDAIASVWWIDDVFSRMFPDEDGDRGHTDEEIAKAREVLRNAERNHNAEIGINWDVLDAELSAIE